MMTAVLCNEVAHRVDALLNEGGVFANVWWEDEFGGRVLKIEIDRGDWKHDHLRARFIVGDRIGVSFPDWEWETEVTDEDGSDCYSAIHTLRFGDDWDGFLKVVSEGGV